MQQQQKRRETMNLIFLSIWGVQVRPQFSITPLIPNTLPKSPFPPPPSSSSFFSAIKWKMRSIIHLNRDIIWLETLHVCDGVHMCVFQMHVAERCHTSTRTKRWGEQGWAPLIFWMLNCLLAINYEEKRVA